MTVDTTRAFTYDPFSEEAMSNPLPLYEYMRDHEPVYYIAEYDAFFLTRFEDVYEFLSAPNDVFVTAESRPTREVFMKHNTGPVPPPSTAPPMAMHHTHPSPTYEILRQAHTKPLKPNAVQGLESFIRGLVNDRLDLLIPRGRFDLTQQYAGIVAAGVQCHLFQIPLMEAKYVLDTINAGSLTDAEDKTLALERYDRLREIVQPSVQRRRREGPDGSWALLDGMFDVRIDGRPLTDREIATTVGIILLGGTETIPKVVAHGLWELYKRPDQWEAVRADPAANAGKAFKEMVRLYAPAQWFVRTVNQPTSIGGVDMRPGQRVVYLIPAAAQDPREYGEDAAEFRWDRKITRWVNFGHGQHFCTGYHLALLEGAIMVEEFVKRVPEFRVLEDRVVRRPSSFQWGYNVLPIVVPGDNAYNTTV